ncbi:MAG TPA: DUF433 domain-containing protein [Gemmatimonadaceae bacterium]
MTLTDSIDIDLTSCWLRGTPIPVELILRKVSEGASDAELLYAYRRLTREDIQAAAVRG